MAPRFQFDTPDDALRAIASKLAPTGTERLTNEVTGRVLAGPVVADRDSPAADVSAMDGYGIRISDLDSKGTLPICGESAPGSPAPPFADVGVMRIFTGAIVPPGCDAVVKREDTEELDGAIRFRDAALKTRPGEHIRRAGENAKAGSTVLEPGTLVTAAHRATMANFGCRDTEVFAPVRVSIITTGDEVGLFDEEAPEPWQLRNSNRAALTALLEPVPWIALSAASHCRDDRAALLEMLQSQLSQSDAILLTGGVSMGDYDYVPDVIREAGGEVAFHGLPLRPGKPILGASTGEGKLILGLPGNPVSATIGCRRMALPLLSRLSGQTRWLSPCPTVRLRNPGDATIPLHWLRLVRMSEHGVAEPVLSQGSGDLVSLGQSSGFVELPASAAGEGPWPYYAWHSAGT